jgi:sugar lactone lactonase YvrE
VLVTLVGPDVGGSETVGIYRIDGPNRATVAADIGQWVLDHPPNTAFEVPTGVQYAMQPWRGGFLVTDGHHNRVLRVTLDGAISVIEDFGGRDIVPTGLETRGNMIFVTQAGPVPHLPENGKVVTFGPSGGPETVVAAGGRLLVDVERGLGNTMFALAQGFFVPGHEAGSPAEPNTGKLLRLDGHGGFTTVAEELNQPTSMEIIGNTAYVVTLGGEIWEVQGIASPPFG